MLWLELETDEQPLRLMPDTAGCGRHTSGTECSKPDMKIEVSWDFFFEDSKDWL